MRSTTNQLPNLGYLHKVVCDCLGLWNSDNEDITFHAAASEKDRRTALRQAFEALKGEDGTMYGSLEDLVVETTRGCTEFCVNGFSFKPAAPGLQTGWRSGSVQLSSHVLALSTSC